MLHYQRHFVQEVGNIDEERISPRTLEQTHHKATVSGDDKTCHVQPLKLRWKPADQYTAKDVCKHNMSLPWSTISTVACRQPD